MVWWLRLAVAGAWVAAASTVAAAPQCAIKTASGTGPNENVARFQAYEGMLKSADMALWSEWMIAGSTTGYRVGRPAYVCWPGKGLGVSCRGRVRICRL